MRKSFTLRRNARMSMPTKLPLRLSMMLLAALLSACGKQQDTTVVVAPTLVHVTQPINGPGAAPIVTTGIVAAAAEIKLSFKVGGVLQHVAVNEGEPVKAGQLLAELTPTEINAALTQAQQANDKAQRDAQRGERLYADQVIALEQLQDLRTQAEVAEAQLKSAQFNSNLSRITAPSAGVILRKLAEDHEIVAPGQPIVVMGASRQGHIVKAALADREVVQLKVGDTASVTLDAFPKQTFTGTVSEVGGAAQSENGLFPIEIQLPPSDAPLVAGLVAQASIQPAAGQATLLYIPTGAVVAGVGNTASVFVLKDGKASKRAIQVAFFSGEQVAVQSGLQADEQVITDGALYLSDGEAVQVAQ